MSRFAALLLAVGCAADGDGPELQAVTPHRAGAGATVTVTGARLCGESCENAGGAIRIGVDMPVQVSEIIAYDDTAAMFRIPTIAAPGHTEITLTVAGRTSNAIHFEVVAP